MILAINCYYSSSFLYNKATQILLLVNDSLDIFNKNNLNIEPREVARKTKKFTCNSTDSDVNILLTPKTYFIMAVFNIFSKICLLFFVIWLVLYACPCIFILYFFRDNVN